MTAGQGVMLIREGRYALALLEAPASVTDLRINRRVEVQGDVLPCALPLLLVDMILLGAGLPVPGLVVGSVVEP